MSSKKNKNKQVTSAPIVEAPTDTAPPVDVTAPVNTAAPSVATSLTSLNYSRLIAQVEALWDYINLNHFGGQLKERPIITIASRGNRSALAWYKHEIWSTGSGARSEINVAAETFSRTRQEVYTTMLHTMVYQDIAEKGIEGVNKVGYHNRNFEKAATAAKLKVVKNGMKGFNSTSLSDDALKLAEAFTGEIDLSVHRNVVKANYKPMIMIPATQGAKNFLKADSEKQKVSMKEVLDNIINSYITTRATETVVDATPAPAADAAEATPEAAAASL